MNKKATLQDKLFPKKAHFSEGQTVYMKGLNPSNKPIVVKAIFIRYELKDRLGRDCMISFGKVRVKSWTSRMYPRAEQVLDLIKQGS